MNNKITTLFLPFFILLFAVATQFIGYLNPDNAWLAYVADQVAGGKVLHKEIIETNPPLIIYLMLIPAFFADFIGIADYHSFTIFVFLLSAVSLFYTYKFSNNTWLNLAVLFMLILYSANNFGQREHLFIMLILPYILAVQNNKNSYIAWILAAIGFAIKPYYILLWVVIELFFAWQKKDGKSVFCLRNYIIAVLILIYLIFLFLIEKDYVNEVLPLMLNYYSGFNWDFAGVFKNVINNFMLFQIPFWIAYFTYKKALTKEIIFYAICNFICIAIIIYQQKGWSNHFYPATFFGVLMNTLLAFELYKNQKLLWHKVAFYASVFVIAIVVTTAIATNYMKLVKVKAKNSEQIITLLNEHADDKFVYPLSFDLSSLFPEILYSKAKFGSRYSQLWMLPGIYANAEKDADNNIIYHRANLQSLDEAQLIKDINSDIAKNQPALIIVSDRKYNTAKIGDFNFDFVEYLSSEKDFKRVFANYQKLTTIDDLIIYKYKEAQ